MERFHLETASCVSAERFQTAPEVIAIKKGCVFNHKIHFLRYLTSEVTMQTKESSLILISVLPLLRTIWLCTFTLEPNRTVPSGEPKAHG